jgi:hypothetical protein
VRLDDWRWAPALASVHFLAAALFCFAVFPRLGEATSGLDPDGYGHLGRVLYETGQFTSIEKAPLYPAFVAVVSAIAGGYRLGAIQLAQCFLSALGVAVVYAIFRRTLPNARLALLAGWGCAVFPLTLWYIPRLWTETFLTVGIALYTLALVRLVQHPGAGPAMLCGLAAGAVALSKGIALVFVPLTVLVLLLALRRAGRKPALIFLAAVLVLLLPWTWRNWRVAGVLLPVHAEGGYNVYLGNGFARHWLQAPLSYVRLKDLTEADMAADFPGGLPQETLSLDQALSKAAWAEIGARPLALARKLLVGMLTFWYLAADTPKSLLTGALQLPLALLAGMGALGLVQRRSRWTWLLLVPLVGIWGVSALVFAFGRLSATVMPYVIALACSAIRK